MRSINVEKPITRDLILSHFKGLSMLLNDQVVPTTKDLKSNNGS